MINDKKNLTLKSLNYICDIIEIYRFEGTRDDIGLLEKNYIINVPNNSPTVINSNIITSNVIFE